MEVVCIRRIGLAQASGRHYHVIRLLRTIPAQPAPVRINPFCVHPTMRVVSSIPRFSLSRDFLLVAGACPIEEARQLLRYTKARWLVMDVGDRPDYYLLSERDLEAWPAGADGAVRLQDALLSTGLHPAPVCSRADAAAAGVPCLIVENGTLAGVFGPDDAGRRTGDGDTFPSRWNDTKPGVPQYLRGALPEEVYAGETAVLAVQVGPDKSPLKVELAGGEELDIVVQAREGFTVEGSTVETLRMPADGSTARLEFRLRAEGPGPGLVRVYAFHDGTSLGTLTLQPVIRAAPVRPAGAGRSPAPGRVRVASVLSSASSFAAADLSLLILEQRDRGRPALSIRVTAGDDSLNLNLKEFGPVVLRMQPLEYFRDFFGDIQALGERGEASAEMVQQKLESKGARLFESIFPRELQTLLWSFRHRITSVQIYSEEAWIPWELCRLTGESDGMVVEGPFFCEAFAITRWIPGIARRPRVTLENMALVMPRDSGLQSVQNERESILSLMEPGRSVQEVPASYVEVRRALASGTFDAFHFAGHGTVRSPDPDRSAIRLERGEELRPEEISGVLRNLGRSTPLVFLNSCHGARGGFTLVGAGGWARRYLDAGAGVFIGAYWAVSDEGASAFAQSFYQEMYAGTPLASAVRSARLAIRSPGDPTWLAYTVYGDPLTVRWQPPADHPRLRES
jgi:hypothetical protein